jgi:glycolate oxidase FAD binding subunit
MTSSYSDSHWPQLVAQAATGSLDQILTPTVSELPAIVQSGQRLLIAGSGSKLAWGKLVQEPTLLISTQRMDRLIDHAVGDLTVTVEAGMTFDRLQAELAKADQFLPLDPLFPQQATIGGIIATADTGSLRQRYGGVRDLLLGVTWVRGDGLVAKAGGRVVKNVAGYDLMKLFTGSYGTLGILQQVTLRVYPKPQLEGGLWVTGTPEALKELTIALGKLSLTPTALDLITAPLAAKLELSEELGLLVRFQTIPASIAAQSEQLLALAKNLGCGGELLAADRTSQIWSQLRAVVCDRPIVLKVGMQTTAALDFLTQIPTAVGVIHLGAGLGLVGLDSLDAAQLNALRDRCTGGFLSVLVADPQFKSQVEVWGQPEGTIALSHQLRQQFDPQNIFNPGKFFPS